MPELFDWVNEKDEFVGQTNKIESHTEGYPHRVAAIFVFDPQGKLLVQHRKKDGLLDHSVGGHVRSGETYDEAAARELGEEIGLKKTLNKIGVFYADERIPTRKHNVIHYFGLYEMRLTESEAWKMVLSDDEIIAMKPMTLGEIAQSMINEPQKWTIGFQSTMNFYVRQKGLKLPVVPLR